MNDRKKDKFRFLPAMRFTPARTITMGFALIILAGALLLNLPAASRSGESLGFLDALFTSTSATCVTGLIVVNTMEHWTWFGKIVMLLLMELGGMGFMTVLTLGLLLFRRRISLKNQLVIQASFNQESTGGMVRLVKYVLAATLIFQALGALYLAGAFYFTASMGFAESLVQGIFHSVSAFCNAGFDNIGPENLVPFRGNFFINLGIMGLIITGGLGFMVWRELADSARQKRPLRKKIAGFSLHTKLALTVTAVLILAGGLLFALAEWNNPRTLGGLPVSEKILASFFQSVTLRTAGFNTIDQSGLTEVSEFISCILMLIGGSPGSTAGGIKTVTLGLILVSILSLIKGRRNIEAFGRSLPLDLLQKALTVLGTMLIVVFVSAILLSFTERRNLFPHGFLDLLFECSSAAGTVGVTTGITSFLSVPGKVIIILCMFLGRLSPVTVAVAMNAKLSSGVEGIKFPEERVIIG